MLDPTAGWSGPASSAGRNADRARCGAGSWRTCSLLKGDFYVGWVGCRCPVGRAMTPVTRSRCAAASVQPRVNRHSHINDLSYSDRWRQRAASRLQLRNLHCT